MKKFIAPEVKVMMVDMTINCMSGVGEVTGTHDNPVVSAGGDSEGAFDAAPMRGIFD